MHDHAVATKGIALYIPSALLDAFDDLAWGNRSGSPGSCCAGCATCYARRRRSATCRAQEVTALSADTHTAHWHITCGTHSAVASEAGAHRRCISLEAASRSNCTSSCLHRHSSTHHAESWRGRVASRCWTGREDNHACASTAAGSTRTIVMSYRCHRRVVQGGRAWHMVAWHP